MSGPATPCGTRSDCRGLPCPSPIIELARAFADLAVGGDRRGHRRRSCGGVDLQAWCRMRGQEYAGSDAGRDGVPTYLVRRLS